MYIEMLNKFQQDLSSRLRDIDVNIIIIKIKQTPGQTPVLRAFFRGRGRGAGGRKKAGVWPGPGPGPRSNTSGGMGWGARAVDQPRQINCDSLYP